MGPYQSARVGYVVANQHMTPQAVAVNVNMPIPQQMPVQHQDAQPQPGLKTPLFSIAYAKPITHYPFRILSFLSSSFRTWQILLKPPPRNLRTMLAFKLLRWHFLWNQTNLWKMYAYIR